MMNRNILRETIKDIATVEVGKLQSVKGNTATAVIKGQVYPRLRIVEMYEMHIIYHEGINGGFSENACRLISWQDRIGSDVIISFIDKNRSNGVIIGLLL